MQGPEYKDTGTLKTILEAADHQYVNIFLAIQILISNYFNFSL